MGSIKFSAQHEALVKESWEVMKPKAPELSLKFFLAIFEIAPETKNLFSFTKDTNEPLEDNATLKSHALMVFKTTCEAAVQLREKGEVVVADNTIKNLGSVHQKKGVQGPHFEVVKEALLRAMRQGMGEKWSEEMGSAWSEAYDQIASAIKAQMN
ncbi:Non-symbiotic hemoglobin 2 [Nymphaea thermarum]|nr:Non-symbiotic hemoglobin 2 [Nymphaea thermarum]